MGQVDAKFLQELSVGDAIIIQHPTSLVEETRIVRMVLSDVSAAISSPFSSDLVSSTAFYYIKAPPEEEDTSQKEASKKQKKATDEVLAFGTYAGGTEAGSQFTYRVKKSGAYGGYAIVKEVRAHHGISSACWLISALTSCWCDLSMMQCSEGNMSREELLDKRSKRKGDRHCM